MVVLGEVGLFVVAAGDVVQGGLVMTSGRGRRRVRAGTDLGGVGAIGTVSRPARGGRSAHDSRRSWGSGRRHGEDVLVPVVRTMQGADVGLRGPGALGVGRALNSTTSGLCRQLDEIAATVRAGSRWGRYVWRRRRVGARARASASARAKRLGANATTPSGVAADGALFAWTGGWADGLVGVRTCVNTPWACRVCQAVEGDETADASLCSGLSHGVWWCWWRSCSSYHAGRLPVSTPRPAAPLGCMPVGYTLLLLSRHRIHRLRTHILRLHTYARLPDPMSICLHGVIQTKTTLPRPTKNNVQCIYAPTYSPTTAAPRVPGLGLGTHLSLWLLGRASQAQDYIIGPTCRSLAPFVNGIQFGRHVHRPSAIIKQQAHPRPKANRVRRCCRCSPFTVPVRLRGRRDCDCPS